MNVQNAKPNRPLSIGQMAEKAGVSERTLRHYENLGLLIPSRTDSNYRTYSRADEKRLMHILAMKACGLPLSTIKTLLKDPERNMRTALENHLLNLREQERALADALDKTNAALQLLGKVDGMSTDDAFEMMKKQGMAEFEEKYGEEARALYGNNAIDDANERMMALSKDEWEAKELLEEAIKVQLRLAMATHDPASDEAQELARMHEKWIAIHWGAGYAKKQYLGLVQSYEMDPRFVKYYDSAAGVGATEFLKQAVLNYQSKSR